MFLRWLSLILIVFPGFLCAEVIPVRSGEHPEFTRLVFTLPTPATKWALTKMANGYGLNVQAEDATFDVSTVFDRVPRSRLADIRVTGNLAALIINCRCSAKAFHFGEKSVVVDISEDKESQPIQAQPEKAAEPKNALLSPILESGANEALKQKYLEIDSFVEQKERREDLENELSKQLNRAVEQGLLNLKKGEKPKIPDGIETHPDGHVTESAGEQGNTNMHALSSVDETLEHKLAAIRKLPPNVCVPDSELDIATWSDGRPMAEQIGQLRRELIREFDKADSEVVLDLARLYIHFAFGAEARQVLALVEDKSDVGLLRALSFLMDGESEAAASFLARHRLCQGQIQFWAMVAGVSPELTDRNANVVQRQFGALPAHLRDHLGPLLIERFLSEGKTKNAEQLVKVLERSSRDDQLELAMAKAHVAQLQNEVPKAEEILTDMLKSEGPMTPQAVVELIKLHEAEFLKPSSDVVDLASAFAVEYRGAELGKDLRRATAVSRMLVGQTDAAFDMLLEIEKRDGTDSADHVRTALVTILVREASDYQLVQAAVSLQLEGSQSLGFDLETQLAGRLYNAGFVELAKRTLKGSGSRKNEQRQLLKARIAMTQRLPKRAEAELLGIQNIEAEKLRIEAKSLAGDHLGASARYGLIDQAELQAEEAWLAGDWQTLSVVGSPEHREFAALRAMRLEEEPIQTAESGDQILSQNRALVDSSQHLRSVSSKVMKMYPTSNGTAW